MSQALERDGYRCLLQPSVLHQAAAAYGAFPDRHGCRLEYLQCAHIFPPSIMRGMSDTDKVCQAFLQNCQGRLCVETYYRKFTLRLRWGCFADTEMWT